MSYNVTESDTFDPTVPVTDVADSTYPAIEAQMGQALANRTRYHENTLTGNYIGTALDLLTTNATLQQYVPIPPDSRVGSGPNSPFRAIASNLFQNFKWLKESLPGKAKGATVIPFAPVLLNAHGSARKWETVASNFTLLQTTNASTDIAFFELPITIRAGTLTSVSAHVLGDVAGGNVHAANKPANMPRIDLYRYVSTGSGLSGGLVGGQVDTAATGAAYDAAHSITLTVSESIAPSATMFWILKVTGESGANSIASVLTLQWLDMTIDGGNL